VNTKLLLGISDFKIKFGSKQCILKRENEIRPPTASCNFQLPKKNTRRIPFDIYLVRGNVCCGD